MGKTVFTITFLIIALIVANKVKTFVKNNRPIVIPENPITEQFFYEDNFVDSTSSTTLDLDVSTTTATSTATTTTDLN